MRYLLAALVAALPFSAWAQCSATLSWTPPSAYDNGDPLNPAEDLSAYRIYSDGEVVATPAPGTQGYVLEDLAYGEYEFTATAVGTNGQESDMSNAASWECEDMRRPEPPQNFLAQLLQAVLDVVRWVGQLFT